MEKFDNISVAVGIITRNNGDFLVTQRQSHQHLAGYWEFPGGKVEKEETVLQALQRELQEELDIVVKEATPFMVVNHTYCDKAVSLHVWWIDSFLQEPVAKEQQPLRWVSLKDLECLPLPAANIAILKKIQAIT
ncbi:MAG: 8-oxo-dGTP diphosphatase MutT [Gammaproteobacteria bacterium]